MTDNTNCLNLNLNPQDNIANNSEDIPSTITTVAFIVLYPLNIAIHIANNVPKANHLNIL